MQTTPKPHSMPTPLQTAVAERKSRLATLEQTLSTVAGAIVELTVRGATEFTVSGEGDLTENFKAVVAYFGKLATFQAPEYDVETDFTVAYFSTPQA